ncbi:hypothetical protein [Ahniella affigens]|uniref:hypothetical protein n=1 Tax=Ahniella affigens TaxID=2021234 RepID=UPI0011B1E507|nr:hypothetical protein [Ahniella affigens]
MHHPPHRFLLALQLNVFDRQRLLGSVANAWQTDQPIALARTWMTEMCGPTDRFPNLLILDMNDTTLHVLDRLWHGDNVASMLSRFRDRFGQDAIALLALELRAV